MAWMLALFRGVLSLVFTNSCVACGSRIEASGFCRSCEDDLPVISTGCHRCGCPGVEDVAQCPNCQDKHYAFDRLVVPWAFGDVVQQLLHGLKYEGRTFLAPVMGAAMARRVRGSGIVFADMQVIPVPLHPSRLRERGYNQSQLLASAIARDLGLATSNALKRVRPTTTQTALGQEERTTNVEGAFSLRRPEYVLGAHVLLVDDVCTTSASQKNDVSRH